MRGPIAWFLLTAAALVPALAQDPFEIHVYEYETLRRGQFSLEQHLNYIGAGSKMPAGSLAPANNQLHLTHELTAGIHERFSLGFMLLPACRRTGLNTPVGVCSRTSTRLTRGACLLNLDSYPSSPSSAPDTKRTLVA